MALPNDKISTTLVANTLGTSSRDVGTLCTHQAINKWSKWKPIKYSKTSPIDEDILIISNFGLILKEYSGVRTMIEAGEKIEWLYDKPQTNDPKRLGDFRNYDRNSVAPIVGVNIPSFGATNPNDGYSQIRVTFQPSLGNGIKLQDLHLEGRKFAIVLYKKDTPNMHWYIAKHGDNHYYVDFDLATEGMVDGSGANQPFAEGNYGIYPIFTDEDGNFGGNGKTIVAIDGTPAGGYPFRIGAMETFWVQLESLRVNSNEVKISAIMRNPNAGTYDNTSVQNIYFELRHRDSEFKSTLKTGEYRMFNNDSISMDGKSRNIMNGQSFTAPSSKEWKLCWSNGGDYSYEIEIDI